jgi:hypothetical protein
MNLDYRSCEVVIGVKQTNNTNPFQSGIGLIRRGWHWTPPLFFANPNLSVDHLIEVCRKTLAWLT